MYALHRIRTFANHPIRSDVRSILQPVKPSPTVPTEPIMSGQKVDEFLRSRGYKV
jgi:hypothetical protein